MVLRGTRDKNGKRVMARFRRIYIKGREHVVSYHLLRELAGWVFLPEDFECDGCSWSPDSWRGFKLWPACAIHDVLYRTGGYGGNWFGRWRADREFRQNLGRLLTIQGAPLYLAVALPWVYWRGVRMGGASSFQFKAGEQPLGFWQRWREGLGVFLRPGVR